MKKHKIKILMLNCGLGLTGSYRMMVDIIENINRQKFDIKICYKPEYPYKGKELLPLLQDKGVAVFPLRGQKLYDINGLKDLWNVIKSEKIDILHCWDSLGFAGRIIGKLSRAKIVDSMANPPVFSSWKNKLLNRATSIFLDGVIFCSNETWKEHQNAREYLLNFCSSQVIYNAVNLKEIDQNRLAIKERGRFGLNPKDIILINMAYFNEQKVQEYIIRSLAEITKTKNNVKLVLLGWGQREPILRKTVEELRLAGRVIFTGKKYHDEALKLLSLSDIYVSSSLWEGLPIAVLEAMAFRKPIVATDIIGNREAVTDGKTGILVPPKNPKAMAEAIMKLIHNPALAKNMGKKGRDRVERVFNIENFISAHEEFYREILSR